MRYALVDNRRTEAVPNSRGKCPTCASEVLSKCGSIVRWHWAHTGQDDCDQWSEETSPWHRNWQQLVPEAWREVTIGRHRADILAIDGTVVELQHSHLAPDEIREREDFYGQMVWIFDVTLAVASGRLNIRRRNGYVSFRWKHPRKSIAACRRPVLLDLGEGQLLRLRRIHVAAPCGGWGHLMPIGEFVIWMMRDLSLPQVNHTAWVGLGAPVADVGRRTS